jgi:IMP cyclohydrolase
MAAMYVGRIAAVARSNRGRNAVLYRVSSRSFPNRTAVDLGGRIAIVPRAGHEGDVHKNPYIAYNCLRLAGAWAIASNGSHTDPIAEKIEQGVPPRDALAACLLALDYEKDQLSTPRIAAVVPLDGPSGWLAIVRRDALVVREVPLEAGRAGYVATYEHDDVRAEQCVEFDAADAAQAARQVFDGSGFARLEKPVTSAAALAGAGGFELGLYAL